MTLNLLEIVKQLKSQSKKDDDQPVTDRLNLRNAAELLDVARLEEQNKLNRRLVRKSQDGTIGQPDEAGTDDMGTTVTLGDQFHITVPPDKEQPPSSPQKEPRKGMSPLLATALTAGAFAVGGPAGVAIYKALEPAVEKVLPAPETTDSDTQYTIRFREE